MHILISGASGFVGGALSSYLAKQGHSIVKLVRTKREQNSIVWDPEKGTAVPDQFEGFDAVIHLAGEPISSLRWTKAKRKKILFSRTVGTFFLSKILSQLVRPPKVFISASAVGFYGDRGEEILTEESEAGRGFLANVCCEWEKAARPIRERGARTVQTRFGMILGPGGGALKKMASVFKMGLGGRIGSGRQWMSWVDREDLIRAIEYALQNESIEGPLNVVSPNPVRQEEFAKILAQILHRPAWLSAPAPLLRLCFGLMADELFLASGRVVPAKLLASGFTFRAPILIDALRKAL